MKCRACQAMFFAMLLGAKAALLVKQSNGGSACESEDRAIRVLLQNRLAGVCIEMCKQVLAYPEDCTCPKYKDTTDKSPGVTTWDELNERMDGLSSWGKDSIKSWIKQAQSLAQVKHDQMHMHFSKACSKLDVAHRVQVQNKLAAVCEDTCKAAKVTSKCACPHHLEKGDKTPGPMTWQELLNANWM
mmetsp:Transcript_88769/g.170835  ORF Transcript_88769/g.170835 Transcript_88769/m.170835 type:complete len:187 (+) Transcript_88769:80-640(+)